MAVRQLEFSLLQVGELPSSIQTILRGRLPATLVNPWILYNIQRNVSLQIARELRVNSWYKFSCIYTVHLTRSFNRQTNTCTLLIFYLLKLI